MSFKQISEAFFNNETASFFINLERPIENFITVCILHTHF